MKTKLFFKFFIILFFFSNLAHSQIFENLIIKGNKKIQSETIVNIIDFNKSKNYTLEQINDFQKKLYESGFFETVKTKVEKNNLIITVSENPIIEFYYLKGVANKSRLKFLESNLELSENKIFSEARLKLDIEKIKSTYFIEGYYDVRVNPTLTKQKNGNLNLILEVNKGEKYLINKINFIGNKSFSDSILKEAIKSSEHGWWKFMSSSTVLSDSNVDQDKFLLLNFYRNEGYYNAEVTSSNIDLVSSNRGDITFSINSGPIFSFGEFKIVDNSNNLTKDNLKQINNIIYKKLSKSFRKGFSNYSRKKVIELKDDIYSYLLKEKIELVKVDIFDKIVNTNIVSLEFIFKNSNRQTVNLIKVRGNNITEEKVIRNNLEFAEGDLYIGHKLEKSKDNLLSSNIFEKVDIKQKNAGNELIDLEINVEEKPTGSISAGVGIGTSESNVFTSIEESNLFGTGIKTRAVLSFGTEQIKGDFLVTDPDFKSSGNRVSYGGYVRNSDFENVGYESTVAGTSISTGYEIRQDVDFTVGLAIDRDKISTTNTASDLYKNQEGTYYTTKGFYGFTKDERNRKFQTSDGYLIAFGQDIAMPFSDIPYIKNTLRGTIYHPFSKSYIFNFKTGISSINAYKSKNIKLSDRLYLTENQLRGFENRGTGPVDNNTHVGGNYSYYSSVSSTFPNPFPENLNVKSILFVDAGNVWGADYDSSKDREKLRSSYGVGLDWMSPLGPLNITLANTITKDDDDLEQKFNFKIGSTF